MTSAVTQLRAEDAAHGTHHFGSARQQYEAGRLGLWLFLATEVLLFGGLFCAYAVYRANHPEIFVYAHAYLDKRLGGANTVILICSSLTMAWAVHAAQRGQQRRLVALLALTLVCASGFLGIKYVEYAHKWHAGLLWGVNFDPRYAPDMDPGAERAPEARSVRTAPDRPEAPAAAPRPADVRSPAPAAGPGRVQPTEIAPAAAGPPGLAFRPGAAAGAQRAAGIKTRPSNVHIFFGIYFAMTGLHGLHVLAGMGVIAWLLVGAVRRRFGAARFAPVDFGGLYWHLVDLIWIYLFPLLYLIH